MTDKEKPNRKINTQGGPYIEGDVNTGRGDFVGGNQNKINVTGGISGGTLVVGDGNVIHAGQPAASLAELVSLVAQIRTELSRARLDEDTRDVIEGDFKVVETQLAKPEPKKALVLPKLKSIAEVLGTAVAAGEAVQKLAPMVQQAITWAQELLK